MENVIINQDMACRKPKKKPACGRVKCSKPGPITNNGYLNFIRSFRRKNCGLMPRELVSKAAKAWNCLPEKTKDKYRRQACQVSNKPKRKARSGCRKPKAKKCRK
ncbi:protamine-like [Drosophila serrata]|uniref:protamine-like n=1 Tax=Drosophila serrata TaxID=7274 RepID=UPI000A1D1F56|nr:protamine-like [Drosophila serrata]XP_020801346.1 protamine-like [Drosophila serrata]